MTHTSKVYETNVGCLRWLALSAFTHQRQGVIEMVGMGSVYRASSGWPSDAGTQPQGSVNVINPGRLGGDDLVPYAAMTHPGVPFHGRLQMPVKPALLLLDP